MPLRPEDQALLALLLAEGPAPFDRLMTAVEEATALGVDLDRVLLRRGVLDPAVLGRFRNELARRWPQPPPARPAPTDVLDRPRRAPSVDTLVDLVGPPSDRARWPSVPEPMLPPPAGLPGPAWPAASPAIPRDPWAGAAPPPRLPPASPQGPDPTPMLPPPMLPHPAARAPAEPFDLKVEEAVNLGPSGLPAEDRYLMYGEIGRGGMGRILRARDQEIGREVAVKVLLGGAQAPANQVRRFWTEVQATGQLEHPSIIPIHDVGRLPSGELYYVMKKLSGQTLGEILLALKAQQPAAVEEFTRARLLTVFQQIAYAVAFAHDHGVIHRDIKPANIMVGRYGEAILIDWGLAKVLDAPDDPEPNDGVPRVALVGPHSGAETASGIITGTPQYMAPEATAGKRELVTPMSDVYGLGAVLYEILTLEPAFADLGFVPTVMQVRQGVFEKPRQRAPDRGITRELEELCLRAMAPDHHARPTAKELADEVGRIIEGTKDRERRAEEAKRRVRAGRRSTERWKTLRAELATAEAEAKAVARTIPPWADVKRKLPLWRLEDRVSELKMDAVSAFEEAEADFLRALGEVPDDREARSALAALYFARYGEAERARDVEAQRYYRNLVSRHDDGVWARVLDGDGTLRIEASPGEVSVSIARLETRDRVLRPTRLRELGEAPIQRLEVGSGSYFLFFHREGLPDLVRPVLVGRSESVHVVVRFPRAGDLGEDFVFIPGGFAVVGGDPVAHGSFEREVVDVPDFAIARFPVTCDQYREFLDDLARRDVERALRHAPRARASEGPYWRFDPERRRFEYPPRTPGAQSFTGDVPVYGVSFRDAATYAEWLSARTGERVRLPREHEWEKAARGVDGRFFPWGDHFDPTFCKMKESRDLPYPEPEPVGSFPVDCSPYGVRDMAGGVRELCVGEQEGRPVPVMRGGCWHDTGLFCRVAFRHVTQPDFVNTGLGFRLAKDLP